MTSGNDTELLDMALSELGMLASPCSTSFRKEYMQEAKRRLKESERVFRVPCRSAQGSLHPKSPNNSKISIVGVLEPALLEPALLDPALLDPALPRPSVEPLCEGALDPSAPRLHSSSSSPVLPRVELNCEYVTHITCPRSRRLEREARVVGLSGCPSPWPRRTRILTSPYLYQPLPPRLPGLLTNPSMGRLARLRGRVRFLEVPPAVTGVEALNPSEDELTSRLSVNHSEDELTSRLSAIQLEPAAMSRLGQAFSGRDTLGLCQSVTRLELENSEMSSTSAVAGETNSQTAIFALQEEG